LKQGKTSRVFTGIELPQSLGQELEKAVTDFNPFEDSLRLVRFQGIHFTLHFFANLSEEKIKELQILTQEISAGVPGFTLELGKPGVFPTDRAPKVLWWGIKASRELSELQSSLNQLYRKHEFEVEERPYVPHLTVGRFRKRINMRDIDFPSLENKWKLTGKQFEVTEIKLFKSPAGPAGYEVLKTFKFK